MKTIRIKKVHGSWYAFTPNWRKETRQLLYPAIGFCNLLNSRRGKR